ncbi:hypothetical protein GP475_00840 [Corynebacterium poyangense]|uniref:J domain-containing protein n=1 Tax=Corynebacterium poyangense TaxID=2684405 RepID=A0A7H0SLB5_9CORY|nr:hypothetical protein [Corynebacterium poyangense]QNQ89340.1 hypothetical protein GP475_00840 [Corynebacterium poyangense]
MATHYNFYQTLQLNEDSSTPELQEELHARLQRMQEDNVPFGSPQYQELQTALTILGDQQRRQKYDARLHDEKAETIDINALRCLAQTGSFPDQFPTAQQPAEGTVGASPRPHHEDAADQGKNTGLPA